MSNPNIDAKNGRAQDARNPVAPCPLKKDKIQLIPVRYGLVEKKNNTSAIHSQYQSMVSFRPIGLRPIVEGYYLYLIHSHRPDIIYCYQIKADGQVQKLEQQKTKEGREGKEFVYQESESSIVVKREGQIHALLSCTPISAKFQSYLLEYEKFRNRVMQSCDLSQYDCIDGAPHLLPPSQLSVCLADQQPQQSDHEHFPWCWEKESPKVMDSAVLLANIQNEYQDDAAILMLDEPIMLMNELSSAYIGLEAAEERWLKQDNNAEKLFSASQLTALVSVGKSQLQAAAKRNKDFINYMNTPQNEQEVIALYNEYSDYQQRYHQVNLNASQNSYGSSGLYKQRDELKKNIDSTIEKLNVLAAEMQVEPSVLISIFQQTRKENRAITDGFWGYKGLHAYIDEVGMAKWYQNATQWLTAHQSSLQNIESDRVKLIEQAYQHIPFFDKSNKDAFEQSLILQNNWLYNIAEGEGNRAKLRHFFFKSLGAQNLYIYQLPEDDKALHKAYFEDGSFPVGDINNGMGVLGGAIAVQGDEAAFDELQIFLTNGTSVTLIPETFDVEVRHQIDLFGLNLNALVLEEINTLKLNVSTGLATNTVLNAMPLGLKAIILGQRHNLDATIEIGTADVTPALNNLNRIVADFTRLETTLKHDMARAVTQSDKDNIRYRHQSDINALKGEARRVLSALAVDKFTSRGPSNIHIKVKPEHQATLVMLENEYRQSLSNRMLFGQDTTPRSASEVMKASPFNLGRSPLGGASLSCLFLWFGVLNFNSTLDSFKAKNAHNDYQLAELLGDGTAMLSSAIATTAGVLSIPVMFMDAKTGNPLWANLGGRLNAVGITAASAFTVVASLLDGMKQFGRIQSSLKKGDNIASIGSAMALTGDGIQLLGSSAITGYGAQQIMAAIRGVIPWSQAGANTFGYAIRFNVWMALAAGFIFAGEIIYNMSQSTPLGRWAKHSWWGNDNQYWPQDEQLYQWMNAVQQPQCFVTTVVDNSHKRKIYNGQGIEEIVITNRKIKTLKLVIPMANPVDVELFAQGEKKDGTWADLTRTLVQGANVTSDEHQIRYEFDWPQSTDKQDLLAALDVVVRVKVPINTTEARWLNNDKGTRFSLSFTTIKKLKNSDNEAIPIDALDDDDEQAITLAPTKIPFMSLLPLREL